jgi:hypothetical protein
VHLHHLLHAAAVVEEKEDVAVDGPLGPLRAVFSPLTVVEEREPVAAVAAVALQQTKAVTGSNDCSL